MKRKGYSIFQRGHRGPWYVAWRDGTGKRRVERASDSKTIAHEIGRAKATEADRVRGGVMSRAEASARQASIEPVQGHAESWGKHLGAKGRTEKYVTMQQGRVERLLKLASVDALSQLTAERIQQALARVSEQHTPNTANHYRGAMSMFCRWCVQTNRLSGTPMPGVGRVSEAGKTFRRYAFTADQLASLYTATETRPAKSPVSGKDRAMFYRVMAYTGFRRSESLSLVPEAFDLDARHPTITVEAGYSKRRRRDTQPIPTDFAELLRPWLKEKTPGKPVFDFPEWMNVERVFRADCAAAGIKPGENEILGVHSLRRFYITSIIRAGGLAVAQDMARHSTPTLTKQYSDLELRDYQKGLTGLPPAAEPAQAAKKRKHGGAA